MRRPRAGVHVVAAAAAALALRGLASCDAPSPAQTGAGFDVTAVLQAGSAHPPTGGTTVRCDLDAGANDAGANVDAGPIVAGTSNLWFVAQACAPAGAWQLAVSVDGTLALAPTGGADAGTSTAVLSFSSDGVHATQLVFGLTSVSSSNGSATVRTTLGDVTQSFDYDIAPAKSVACIAPVGDPTLLAWSVVPPSPLVLSDGDIEIPDGAVPVATVIVDLRVQLSQCPIDWVADGGSDGGCPNTSDPLAGSAVSVMGTGGLEPTSPTFTTDSCGFGAFELRGPAVVDAATAVLTYQQGSTYVTWPPDGDGGS